MTRTRSASHRVTSRRVSDWCKLDMVPQKGTTLWVYRFDCYCEFLRDFEKSQRKGQQIHRPTHGEPRELRLTYDLARLVSSCSAQLRITNFGAIRPKEVIQLSIY